MLSIIRTTFPNGKVVHHPDGIEEVCLWDLTKQARLENKARKGGVNYSDLSAFEQSEKQLKLVKSVKSA